MDLRIRIRTKISWIRNTGEDCTDCIAQAVASHYELLCYGCRERIQMNKLLDSERYKAGPLKRHLLSFPSVFWTWKLFRSTWSFFYIERGLHSRTEIGEREIYGSTVHSIGAVGNRTLFSCLPLPPPLHDLIRGAIWSPTSLSPPPLTPCPPSHHYPFWTVWGCSGRSWGWPLIWRSWVW